MTLARCCRHVLGLLLALPLSTQVPVLSSPAQVQHARVIVKLKADASVLRSDMAQAQSVGGDASTAQPMRRLGLKRGLGLRDGRQLAPRMHLAFADGIASEQLAAELGKDPDVQYVVVDHRRRIGSVPNDPYYLSAAAVGVGAGQWYLRPPGTPAVAAINAQQAWDIAKGDGVTVAVLDTGVRLDHEDLAGKLYPGFDMISDPTVGRNSGRSNDASDRGDWVNLNDPILHDPDFSDCKAQNSSWHGTQVSGVVGAATNNSLGMAGVGWNANVLPVRVLGKCGGFDSDIIDGMRWAAGLSVNGVPTNTAHPARILNLSLGDATTCDAAYRDVIAELAANNVVVVASAGNSSGHVVEAPANCPGVIAVAAVRHTGTKVGYSSMGPEVTISAPGGNCVNDSGLCLYPILTTSNSGLTTPVANADGGSIYTGGLADASLGTSFSAPQVSGVVALMRQVRPGLTPPAVASALRMSARPFMTVSGGGVPVCRQPDSSDQVECVCTTTTCGAGTLDAYHAVLVARDSAVPVIQVNPEAPAAGQSMQLSAAGSMSSPLGTRITSLSWQMADESGAGVFLQQASSDNVVVLATPGHSGPFRVRLTVQDDANQTATLDQWVYVRAPAAAPSDSGGGGGGAVDLLTLGWLGLAGLAAWRRASRT